MIDKNTLIQFILSKVAHYTSCNIHELTNTTKFEEVGVTSLYAVLICGELEDEFGFELEPILLFNYKTADEVANYLLSLKDG